MIDLYDVKIVNTEQNINGRTYPLEILEKMKDKINTSTIRGTIGYLDLEHTNLTKVSHVCKNAKIENNILVCDIQILDTPGGETLQQIINDVVFRPACKDADVGVDGKIASADLILICAIDKKRDAYEGKI